MVGKRWAVGGALFVLGSVESARAQSVSIDEKSDGKSQAAAPAQPSREVPQPPPQAPVRPPAPLSTGVDYPEGARGESEVVLIITVASDGSVKEASVVSGSEPFATQALSASKGWKFSPAERDGKPVPAKVRFSVRFTPPTSGPDEPPVAAGAEAPMVTPPKAKPSGEGQYEIVVVGAREPLRHQLGRAEVHDMPGAFGDPYRAIEVLPGVVPIVSGLPYFYVRGAPPGNVGYFFDGVPVPYLYHFAAGPGVLHPAFVDHVDLYPAAYPARYGRFAGAIVAGEMAEPGFKTRGEASIRLVDSGAMLEAPFADGRGSIMLGGRFSYTGLVLSLIVPELTLNYWDYQARIRYQLGRKDRVEVLSFGSRDFLSQTEKDYGDPGTAPVERENTIVDVGFHRLDLRWDHAVEGGTWRNALLTGFDRTGADDGNVSVTNYIAGVRSELNQTLKKGIELRAGADFLFEALKQKVNTNDGGDCQLDVNAPGAPPAECMDEERDPTFGFNRSRRDFTAGVRADLVWDVAPHVQIIPGLRFDLYNSGSITRFGVDPRVSVRYDLSDKLSIVHGLSLVHQAPSFVVPVPGFKPSLSGGLQRALQSSAGITYKLPSDISASLTVFQNAFFNMTDFIGLAQLDQSGGGNLEDARSLGHAYGVEAMVRRSLSRDLGGFLSYTLSRSVRTSGIASGPATTDRTSVLNLGASYNLGRNWRLGGRVLFYSGIPAQVAYIEAAKSPPRTPPFWRLDVKLQKRWYIVPNQVWWGLVFEALNTTLNKEVLNADCNAYRCTYEKLGPVTVPSIGAEGAF
jgi:TonB family protein